MRAWLAQTYSDEDGLAVEGKSVIVHGTKTDMKAIAEFMASVVEHLEGSDYCHMHLQDHMPGWKKDRHVDIEMTVDERAD